MSKKVSINFHVEAELRDRFNAAAKLKRRPASQVLQDLMHGYIGEVERKRRPVADRKIQTIVDQFMRDEVSIRTVSEK